MKQITLLVFSILSCFSIFAQRADNYKPTNPYVYFTQTNLPIVFINTGNTMILREDRIAARMTIIYNGEGKLNYADTLAHPDQSTAYKGRIGIKYRGNSSFTNSDKKPYSFRPENESGKKQEVALLGMGADSDWCLLAPYSDKSLIRDMLTFKLAKPYFEYVPDGVHCEVVLDGTYYGVYILSERVRQGANRLNIPKPGNSGDELTGGYHVEVDRDDEVVYTSNYNPQYSWGASMINKKISFQYKYPEFGDLTNEQKVYLHGQINKFENSLAASNYKDKQEGYRKYLDVTSFIDYMLSTEFARNVDGYRLSTNLYKHRDSVDPRFKMSLWDFNLGFGNANYNDGWNPQSWAYNTNDVNPSEAQLIPFWWYRLLSDPAYVKEMKERWTMYRSTNYSNANIMHVVDSLTDNLNKENAQYRNSLAWPRWNVWVWPNKYVASSYNDEINYMKDWITKRLAFMDGTLYTSAELPQTPTVKISPNPVRKGEILHINGAQLKSVRLISFSGALIKQGDPSQNNLSMQGVLPGSYLLVLETTQGWITEKILVRN